jgi:hypothetical protein
MFDYFAHFETHFHSGMALTSGDFDSDGDLDVIVGAYNSNKEGGTLHFLENDGKGNFTARKSSSPLDLW